MRTTHVPPLCSFVLIISAPLTITMTDYNFPTVPNFIPGVNHDTPGFNVPVPDVNMGPPMPTQNFINRGSKQMCSPSPEAGPSVSRAAKKA